MLSETETRNTKHETHDLTHRPSINVDSFAQAGPSIKLNLDILFESATLAQGSQLYSIP